MNEPESRESGTPLLMVQPGYASANLETLVQLEELKSQQIELELQLQELQARQQEAEVLLQHYTRLFDWSPVCFVCLDHLGRIRHANQAAATLLHGDMTRLLGAYLTQYIVREDRDRLRQLVRQAGAAGPPPAVPIRLRHQEGVFHFLAQGLPPQNNGELLCQVAILEKTSTGQPTAAPPSRPGRAAPAAAAKDDAALRGHAQAEQFITRLVKGLQVPQEHLLAQIQLVRAWLEGMPEGVLLCDAQGKILFINSAAAFLLADLIETTPVISHAADCWEDDLFYHADRQTPCRWEDFPMQRVLNGETLHREKLWISRPGGYTHTWLQVSGHPLRDIQGNQCGAVFLLNQQSR